VARLRQRLTTRMGIGADVLRAVVIGLGLAETIGRNTLGGGYDHRSTVGVWFRSIVFLHPEPDAMVGAPVMYNSTRRPRG
jgi:nitrate reductase gamma subunit